MPRPITKYLCDHKCGHHAFSKISHCQNHEARCWSNPALRSCKSCKFEELVHDSDGSGWIDRYRDCKNPLFEQTHGDAFDYDKRVEGQIYINPILNCPLWEPK